MKDRYDPRCSICAHYPWTRMFIGSAEGTFCKCKCHNDIPINRKLMRFSINSSRKNETSHVMHVPGQLVICPFCKRSDFDDSVYHKRDNRHNLYYERMYEAYPPCFSAHEHEIVRCKCGRLICAVAFSEYFGYELNDDLFSNHLVDQSRYSEEEEVSTVPGSCFERNKKSDPLSDEVPTYENMATIKKIWGKLPIGRSVYDIDSESIFLRTYQGEQTIPPSWRTFNIVGPYFSPEEMSQRQAEAEKEMQTAILLDVSGIGEVTAKKLLKKFHTADKVFSATTEQIAKIPGLSTRAKKIKTDLDGYEYTKFDQVSFIRKSLALDDFINDPMYRQRRFYYDHH